MKFFKYLSNLIAVLLLIDHLNHDSINIFFNKYGALLIYGIIEKFIIIVHSTIAIVIIVN